MGQKKGGEWTEEKNAKLLKKMDTNGDGLLDSSEFAEFFEQSLTSDSIEFDETIENFMKVAKQCPQRKEKAALEEMFGSSDDGKKCKCGPKCKCGRMYCRGNCTHHGGDLVDLELVGPYNGGSSGDKQRQAMLARTGNVKFVGPASLQRQAIGWLDKQKSKHRDQHKVRAELAETLAEEEKAALELAAKKRSGKLVEDSQRCKCGGKCGCGRALCRGGCVYHGGTKPNIVQEPQDPTTVWMEKQKEKARRQWDERQQQMQAMERQMAREKAEMEAQMNAMLASGRMSMPAAPPATFEQLQDEALAAGVPAKDVTMAVDSDDLRNMIARVGQESEDDHEEEDQMDFEKQQVNQRMNAMQAKMAGAIASMQGQPEESESESEEDYGDEKANLERQMKEMLVARYGSPGRREVGGPRYGSPPRGIGGPRYGSPERSPRRGVGGTSCTLRYGSPERSPRRREPEPEEDPLEYMEDVDRGVNDRMGTLEQQMQEMLSRLQ